MNPYAPLIRDRLVSAMREAGFVKPDGTVNKSSFARALCRADGGNDGDRNQLESWSRLVFAWTSKKRPSGISRENARLAAQVLSKPEDYLLPEALIRREGDRIEDELRRRLSRLERMLGLPPLSDEGAPRDAAADGNEQALS